MSQSIESSTANGECRDLSSLSGHTAPPALENREQYQARKAVFFFDFLQSALKELAPLFEHIGSKLAVELTDQARTAHIGDAEPALYAFFETVAFSVTGSVQVSARTEQAPDGRTFIVAEAFGEAFSVLDKARRKLIEAVTGQSGEVAFVTEPRKSGIRVRIPAYDLPATDHSVTSALH